MPSSITNFYVSAPIMVYSLDYDTTDENTPPPTHLPLGGSIEHELTPIL
jgi:hypothetical protein